MTKRYTDLILGLSLVLLAGVLVTGLLNCSVMTEFDKPLVLPDELACLDDDDCWSDESPQDDCNVCNTDTHTCAPEGTNADSDDFFVCERALERGTADCDDTREYTYPGAHEAADLLDNDCDGIIDDGALEAKDAEPDLIRKPTSGCEAPCLWSSPRMGWADSSIYAVWESDEGRNQDRLRVAEFDVNGASTMTEQLLVLKSGGDDHNMTEAGIAKSRESSSTRTYGAVWIDLLGGRTIDLMRFQFSTDAALGIERTAQEWPDDQNVLRETHRDAAHPVIIAREGHDEYLVAWSGRDVAETGSDIFLAKFTAPEPDGMVIDTSRGADGFVNLSQTTGESEEGRPGLAQAGSGLVAAWINEAEDAIRIVYMTDYGATAPALGDIRTVPLPGIQDGSGHALRDLVIVRNEVSASTELAYLIFCGVPDGQSANEVWAVSVDLNSFASGLDADVFGTPLRISDSPAAPSIEAAAAWYDRAIGIAWSERRDGHNHVYFRRIADLETSRETSGVLASDEINLSADELDDTVNVYGQGPAIVATDSDQDFAVMWWQRQPAGGGTDTGDLYLRLVRPKE
ncbi:MAG: putative metal-binding motif-containing protein [Deltaproteobacteria bacterium]|nr:putative metal-binding motif-containing protein [Deltaproteobacteria bacterium]